MRNKPLIKMCVAALLIAVGIVIPLFSPKITFGPMSFTLASHVAIFIAMLISPAVAVSVAAGTTLGFVLTGLPIVIVFRAASHVIFAWVGAVYLSRHADLWRRRLGIQFYSLCVGLIHALAEFVVVSVFFFNGMYTGDNFVQSVLLLVGVGTLAHSMVDFIISQIVVQALGKIRPIRSLFHVFGAHR